MKFFIFLIFTILGADDIANTPHDFSSNEEANGSLCIYCHVSPDMKIEEPSLLCLSCHDGVSSSIALNNSHQGLQKYNFGESAGNHPIAIKYAPNERLKEVEGKGLLRGPGEDMIECTSCHDPHKKKVGNEVNFLRYSNKNSNLCYQCHKL